MIRLKGVEYGNRCCNTEGAGGGIKELRGRIQLAEEALRAIRANEIDALVVGSDGSERVRTLGGADLCYRTFVETMGQGAATVSGDGTILYCNGQFCRLLRTNPVITAGASIFSFVSPEDEGRLRAMLWEAMTGREAMGSFCYGRAMENRSQRF